MIKKKNILSAILLLGLALSPINYVNASGNALVQMDIKKSAGDSVDVTLFTTGAAAENPVVTKKSDNKYVILMPNVSGNQSGKPDLAAINDIISDVDIKSVEDGAEGYTKVTLITKKPINIKTNIETSGEVPQEQAEYRQLIAKARANGIKTSRIPSNEVQVSEQKKAQSAPKTIVTVNKAKTETKKVQNTKTVQPKKTAIKFKEVSAEELMKKHTPSIPAKTQAKPVKLEQVDIKETSAPKIAEKLPEANAAIKNEMDEQIKKSEQKLEQKTAQKSEKEVMVPVNPEKADKNRKFPFGFAVGLIPVLGLLALIKMIRTSVQRSAVLKQSFMENLNNRPAVPENYDDIIENEELSWQEKYNKYLDKTAPEKALAQKPKKQSRYKFISFPQKDEVEEKREELERTLAAPAAEKEPVKKQKPAIKPKAVVTSIEKIEKLDDKPPVIKEVEPPKEAVKAEDTVIHEEMHKTVKLKAFAKGVSLEETSRRKSLNKKAAKMLNDDVTETATVPLRSSKLSSNVRRLSDANLKMAEVTEKGIEEVKAEQDYEVTSIDEYLSIVDADVKPEAEPAPVVEPAAAIAPAAPAPKEEKTSVAASLAQVKPSMKYQKPYNNQSTEISNPITRNTETKKSYMDSLIVKSGYNIDEERGFYVVNVDGTSALVGRVKDEVFVLKKFDNNVEKPLQVRRDQPNVFMVKADGYRSLVKIDEEKMGVLVEM